MCVCSTHAFLIRQHQGEVVADPFVQVHAHRQAERRRQVDPRCAVSGGGCLKILHFSHGGHYRSHDRGISFPPRKANTPPASHP
jgi:hypothetical protein